MLKMKYHFAFYLLGRGSWVDWT